jgi:hypothetical protein
MRKALSYQPTLFELPAKLQQPAVVLDIKLSRRARNEGIQKAVDHAEKENVGWNQKAYDFLIKFLNNHNGYFMAEEVRVYAQQMNFELPPSNRAWGGVILKASRSGLIQSCGIHKVKNKRAHCANAAVWRQVKTI